MGKRGKEAARLWYEPEDELVSRAASTTVPASPASAPRALELGLIDEVIDPVEKNLAAPAR